MIEALKQRQSEGTPIRVGLIGAGAMGTGIVWQVTRTPGMEIVFIGDTNRAAAEKALKLSGADPEKVRISDNPITLLESDEALDIDVLVEASNTIGAAARYCFAAIRRKAHVVLMNAEVDLALGILLQHEAKKAGVVVTSDAGDQHGVLKTMIDEIQLWGFDIVQAGNIKGFLKRDATGESLKKEAEKRNLSVIQCCAYTDGTKLNIEMACIANSLGLTPTKPGMEGPLADDVREVLDLFDLKKYNGQGHVDYILGAEPGGGVYVIGHCDDPLQADYMEYYKMGHGPFFLFYRPYHLCHVETPRAIAEAVINKRALLTPEAGRLTDVYAYAKRDLIAGEEVDHSIGGDLFYGLIEVCADADAAGKVPIALMEADAGLHAKVLRDVKMKTPVVAADIQLPDTYLVQKFKQQQQLIDAGK
jgi:predicted homoserine dehydrogenase-like protein